MRKESVNWQNYEVDKQNLNYHRNIKELEEATWV